MKTLLLSIFLISICLTKTQASQKYKSLLTEFFNSLFSTRDLKTYDILECFDETSSQSLIKYIEDVMVSLEYFMAGDYDNFEDQHWKLSSLQLDFIDSIECAYELPEMKAFLNSIGHDEQVDDSFESLKLRWDLFYFGNPEKLLEYLKIVYAYFETDNAMNAGLYLGEVAEEMMTHTNPRSNAINSWINGIFKGLELSPPIELHRCSDEKANLKDKINNLYYFYYLWSGIASRALPAFSLETTEEYLREATRNFKDLISSKLWKCVMDGPDSRRLKRMMTFNINPYDEAFNSILKSFLSDSFKNAWTYQTVMGSLEADWKNGYYFQSGEDFSKFLLELGKVYGVFTNRNLTLGL